ncbi:MAG: PD-(D/E)XK nuclease family protein [Candidatus Omnitrophota bacterium]
MSKYYTPRRANRLYKPNDQAPFKLSRSKIELFIQCPRCFYLDRRLGVGRPPGYPYTLNSAVDTLLKKEFDLLRKNAEAHLLMEAYGVDAVVAGHPMLNEWRNNFRGVRFFHKSTNLILYGAIDDLWKNSRGEYIIVDYKSTSKNEKIVSLDKDWQDAYKRQMEIYQWLARRNELKVSNTGYFVYCNGRTDVDKFDGRLEFDITLISYEGDDGWVEPTVVEMHGCLNSDIIPQAGEDCDFCAYRGAAREVQDES